MREAVISLILAVPTILIALTFHEYAHARAASWLGDPTARSLGRLTLNPLKHLDPIGTIMMLIIGIGYAKPVPVNSRYFKNPKWGMALTALAGPVMNMILSFFGIAVYMLYLRFLGSLLPTAISWAVLIFFSNFAYLNAYLAIFNLIPVPPFDGSRIAFAILPDRIYWSVMKYERIIMIVTLLLIITMNRVGLNPFSALAEGFTGAVGALFEKILF